MAEFHRRDLTPSGNVLLDMAHRLKDAVDAKDISQLLTQAIRPYGYDRFVYARIPTNPGEPTEEYVHLDTLDPAWMAHYMGHDMFQADWLADYCLTGQRPMPWSEVQRRVDAGEITGAYARVTNAARDWGVRNGVTLPLPCLGRFHAGVSLVADAKANQAEQDRAFHVSEQVITTTLQVFHAGVDMGGVARDFYGLTRREVEVLKWQSEGYRTKDIASKLRTSAHTVEKQAKSARLRLKAASSTQAVAKAILLGIIT